MQGWIANTDFDFLDRSAASGDSALGGLPRSVGPETGFRARRLWCLLNGR